MENFLRHGVVVGVSQTLRRWSEGATYSAGRPSRWACPHSCFKMFSYTWLAHILLLKCFHTIERERERCWNLLLMAALSSRCGHYIFILWFLLSLWPPYAIGQAIILLFCGFFFMVALWSTADDYIFILRFLLSFFPRLISAVGNWMSAILPHIMWL